MELVSEDHTRELETRLKAIRINPDDSCVFFRVRDDCVMLGRRCRYCRYGNFDDDWAAGEAGFCRFKS